MAQNFQSYNPMQVGQGTANVFSPSAYNTGDAYYDAMKTKAVLGAKQKEAETKADKSGVPTDFKFNFGDASGMHSKEISDELIGSFQKQYADMFNREGGVTKGNVAKFNHTLTPYVETTNNIAKADNFNTENYKNILAGLYNTGDYVGATELQDVVNKEKAKYSKGTDNEDINGKINRVGTSVKNIGNLLSTYTPKNIAIGKEGDYLRGNYIPKSDKDGSMITNTIDNGDGTYTITTEGGTNERVSADKILTARNSAVRDANLRHAYANNYAKSFGTQDPNAIANSYIGLMQERGFRQDKIDTDAKAMQEALKSDNPLANVYKVMKNGNMITTDIENTFNNNIGYKRTTVNSDKLQFAPKGSGSGSSNVVNLEGYLEVKGNTTNGNKIFFNRKATDLTSLKGKAPEMTNTTGYNALNGQRFKTEAGKETYVTKAVPLYHYKENNGFIPIFPSGKNNQSFEQGVLLYNNPPKGKTREDISNYEYKVGNKTYKLKDLLNSNKLSSVPTLVVGEYITKGTTGADGLPITTPTGTTILVPTNIDNVSSYTGKLKGGTDHFNNLYKESNNNLIKAINYSKGRANTAIPSKPATPVKPNVTPSVDNDFKF